MTETGIANDIITGQGLVDKTAINSVLDQHRHWFDYLFQDVILIFIFLNIGSKDH